MKILVGNEKGSYTFSAIGKTITLTGFSQSIKLEQVLLITNITTNDIIYSLGDNRFPITISNNIITITKDTSLMADANKLQIFLDAPALAYDSADDMMKIKSMQKKFRDSFGGSAIDTEKWVSSIGTGMVATVSSGVLTVATGTTANALTTLTSNEIFTVPFRLSFNLGLSQRIANQSFFIEMISVNPLTGLPDGLHSCGYLFDGTTATQGKYFVQNNAVSPLTSGAVTVPTTAGAVSIYEVEPFCDEVWFHGKSMDSSGGRTNSYVRHQQIPDPNASYKIRIRVVNGSTAPASTTSLSMQFIACQDYAELTAEITSGRGQSVAGQGIGVYMTGGVTQTITGTITANQGSFTAPTPGTISAAASTNTGFLKASAGTVYMITLTNYSASPRYLKLYNKTTAPTIGTDTPVMTIPVLANSMIAIPFGTTGKRFSTGIAYALTGGMAISDTTATNLLDSMVTIDYI